ncbi:MAG: hypothetical protein FWD12_02550 [Alphaproteobacteria bacterium]|nr:hypothetical protein [Alphaproteobacteria bacterium]
MSSSQHHAVLCPKTDARRFPLISNAASGESVRRLDRMRESPEWRWPSIVAKGGPPWLGRM